MIPYLCGIIESAGFSGITDNHGDGVFQRMFFQCSSGNKIGEISLMMFVLVKDNVRSEMIGSNALSGQGNAGSIDVIVIAEANRNPFVAARRLAAFPANVWRRVIVFVILRVN